MRATLGKNSSRSLGKRKKTKAGDNDLPTHTHVAALLIDEIQNAPGDAEGPAAALLNSIHEAVDQLPIFPVYGGLAWAEDRLDELGISRLSNPPAGMSKVQTLNPLPESESRAVCGKFFEHFGISGARRLKEHWASEIVQSSLGWPHHLHTHLQALGDALLKPGIAGDLDGLERLGGGTAVGEMAAKARGRYYGRRLTRRVLQKQGRLAAEAALRVGLGKNTVARLGREIERIAAAPGEGDPDMELPEGMNGKAFAEAMIRAGILHEDSVEGTISVPIPSFLDYLAERFGARGNLETRMSAGAKPPSGAPS